jgi:hypothetical protein
MREELRGLLVLRYGVTTRFTQKLGAEVTRDLFICAEEKLLREGFRPGADGIDLRALEAEAADSPFLIAACARLKRREGEKSPKRQRALRPALPRKIL